MFFKIYYRTSGNFLRKRYKIVILFPGMLYFLHFMFVNMSLHNLCE